MNYIEEKWESYRETIPKSVSGLQILEARLGFYSGATAMYSMMMAKARDASVTQEEGEAYVKELDAEIKRFHQELVNKSLSYFLKGSE